MTIYISLLRGINVGGHRKIKMADLNMVYADAGMNNVKSYIQSGNVVFTSDAEAATVQQKLETAIEEKFGFPVDVIIRTADQWAQIAAAHPYEELPNFEEKKVYLTVFSGEPTNTEPLESDVIRDEKLELSGDVAYLYCTNGRGKTKLNNDLLERHYGLRATTRNWKTTRKLVDIAENLR